MKQWISDYIKGCAICQQMKTQTHKRPTPIYRIPTTPGTLPFRTIAMDLITGLPNRQGFNAILTIVDHGCSRAAIFLPCTTNISGPGIAQLYLDYVYRWFGLPTKIISDRDPCFTSHFRKAITKKLGIKQNLSTAFHPQTDGLSERKNQWIEQYLHTIVASHPEDWSYWVAIASAVHNNQINTTIGLSPNEILLGYSPHLAPSEVIITDNEAVEKQVKRMMQACDQATKIINQNAGEAPSPQFTVGDQVWLEGSHLKLPHQSTKLAPKRYGPFTITKQINPVTYQLILPATWQIHPVFHASLLSPYVETDAHGPNYSRPPPDLIGGEEFYEVEQIHGHRCHGHSRTLQYLIKWKGSPESDNTWEPADQVLAPDLLREYHKHRPLSGIKANQLIVQSPQHPPWILPNHSTSSARSCALLHSQPISFTSSNPACARTRICRALSRIAADHTSLISTPSNTGTSVKNTTVAIIPEDHLQCQPRTCRAASPLPPSHPLHPCPFQCTSHPLNRPRSASPGTLASELTTLFNAGTSPRKGRRLPSPPSTRGDFPSPPPLYRTSLQPLLTRPPNSLGQSSMGSPPRSGSEMTSIERRWKDSRPTLPTSSSRSMTMETDLPNVRPVTRRTTGDSPISPSPSTMEQSGSPVSSNNLMMEELPGYTAEPRVRRRHELLSYTPLPTTHLTNPSNPSLPGFTTASGATAPLTPFSRTPSTTSTTGGSLPMSTDTDNSTRITHTWSRSWSFSRPNGRASSRTELLSRTASSMPDSARRSSISLFDCLRAPFNRPGRGGVHSNHHNSSTPRDEDVSM